MATETHMNDAGTWRAITEVHVNDAGTWRSCIEKWVNDSGVWRLVFTLAAGITILWQTTTKIVANTGNPATQDINFISDGSMTIAKNGAAATALTPVQDWLSNVTAGNGASYEMKVTSAGNSSNSSTTATADGVTWNSLASSITFSISSSVATTDTENFTIVIRENGNAATEVSAVLTMTTNSAV